MLRFRHPLSRAISLALAAALCAFVVPALAAPGAAPAPAGNLADVQAQAAAARAKLDAMRKNLDAGMAAFDSASNDLASTRAEIERNNRELVKVQSSLAAGQAALDGQAQFLYRTDGAGFIDVLLGAHTFDDFAARLSVLQSIASKDAGLVSNLKKDRAEQTRILGVLQQREAQQQALVAKVGAQRNSVQSGLDSQQAYLDTLSSQVSALVAQQERAAAAAHSSSTGGSGHTSVGSGPPAKSAPAAQSGPVALKLATVTGRPGQWWVMAKESSTYRPSGVTFSGEASEYGTNDNGTGTSSGRPLNDNELTCAHPSLAFGTRIAVTHGSKRVIVVVTDRGPYSGGRVIDLTHRAASLLGVDGVGMVKCEVVSPQ